MINHTLRESINLNKFLVNVYSDSDENIDIGQLNTMINVLQQQEHAKDIIDLMQNINGVSKLEIIYENRVILVNEKI